MLNNQKMKAKVVLLSTNQRSNLWITDRGLVYNPNEWFDNSRHSKHLYLISDREIKEGDWYLYLELGVYKLLKCTGQYKSDDTDKVFSDKAKKIEATTDPELQLGHNVGRGFVCNVHKISQNFIKKYVEMYNKGTPIVDVMVDIKILYSPNGNYWKTTPSKYESEISKTEVMVNESNEVSIHPIKDSFTRNEVLQILISFNNAVHQGFRNEKELDDWYDKNL